MRSLPRGGALLLGVIAAVLATGSATMGTARAASPAVLDLAVNTFLDPDPANTTTTCESPCSLRKAVNLANQQLSNVVTVVHVPAGTYRLTRQPDPNDTSAGGALSLVRGQIEIRGADAATTIVEQGPDVVDRVFEIETRVRVSGITIRNGRAPDGTNFPARIGGGVFVGYAGSLDLERSVITANHAPSGAAPQAGFGGGIAVSASNYAGNVTTLRDVTLAQNTAAAGGAGLAVLTGSVTVTTSTINDNRCPGGDNPCIGGGIYSSGTLKVVNSTLDGNLADQGGGLYTDNGEVRVTNATISDNRLGSSIAGLARQPGKREGRATTPNPPVLNGAALYAVGGYAHVTLAASIVAGNPLDECGVDLTNVQPKDPPAVASDGSNIDDGVSCLLQGPGDQHATNPALSPLADNGGATRTRAIGPGSPALDAVKTTCPPPARDQRGIQRASLSARTGSACDIGAFEYQGPAPVATPAPTPTSVVKDVIVFVPYTPRLPAAGVVAAGPPGRLPPLTPFIALVVAAAALLTPLAYHRARREIRGDKDGR